MAILHPAIIFYYKTILIIVVVQFPLWIDIIENLYVLNIQSYIYSQMKLFFLVYLYLVYINYNFTGN